MSDRSDELRRLRERVKELEGALKPLIDQAEDDWYDCPYCEETWGAGSGKRQHKKSCPVAKARALLTDLGMPT